MDINKMMTSEIFTMNKKQDIGIEIKSAETHNTEYIYICQM